jgi:hypothetical protein
MDIVSESPPDPIHEMPLGGTSELMICTPITPRCSAAEAPNNISAWTSAHRSDVLELECIVPERERHGCEGSSDERKVSHALSARGRAERDRVHCFTLVLQHRTYVPASHLSTTNQPWTLKSRTSSEYTLETVGKCANLLASVQVKSTET